MVQRHLPQDAHVAGEGDDRHGEMVLGENPGGGAGLAPGDDELGVDVLHDPPRPPRQRRGRGVVGGARSGAGVVTELVDDVLLGDLRDVVHRVNRAQRVFAHRRLGAEHHRVGPVQNGVGHVTHLGPGGRRLLHHALEHLRRHDDRLARVLAAADQVLLDDRHLGHVHLHPQVAAGDHQAVAHLEDAVDLLDGLGLFDLGDQLDGAVLALEVEAEDLQVVRLAHERQGEVVQVVLDRPFDAVPVAVGDAGDVDVGARKVDPLAALDHAADGAAGSDLVAVLVGADEPEQPVLDHEAVADLEVVDQAGVGGADPSAAGDNRVALDGQVVARRDGHAAGAVLVGDLPDADLRATQVAEHGDRPAVPARGLTNLVEDLSVAVEVAVGKVEPADVDALLEEGDEPVDSRAGGTHRGDDLSVDHDINRPRRCGPNVF